MVTLLLCLLSVNENTFHLADNASYVLVHSGHAVISPVGPIFDAFSVEQPKSTACLPSVSTPLLPRNLSHEIRGATRLGDSSQRAAKSQNSHSSIPGEIGRRRGRSRPARERPLRAISVAERYPARSAARHGASRRQPPQAAVSPVSLSLNSFTSAVNEMNERDGGGVLNARR